MYAASIAIVWLSCLDTATVQREKKQPVAEGDGGPLCPVYSIVVLRHRYTSYIDHTALQLTGRHSASTLALVHEGGQTQ